MGKKNVVKGDYKKDIAVSEQNLSKLRARTFNLPPNIEESIKAITNTPLKTWPNQPKNPVVLPKNMTAEDALFEKICKTRNYTESECALERKIKNGNGEVITADDFLRLRPPMQTPNYNQSPEGVAISADDFLKEH